MEENTLCPVCEDVACDLVALSCGHRTCKDCLTRYWEQKNAQDCPLCWTIFSDEPRPNVTIKRRLFSQDTVPPNRFCARHGYPFSLYCMDDGKLVCPHCELFFEHNGHEFWSVERAAQERKIFLRYSLNTLATKFKGHRKVRVALNEMTQHVKSQARQTEREIKDEFEKLHRFLREEEEARITVLIEEEEQKSQMLKERIEKIKRKTKEIHSVLDAMRTIEQALEEDDISFLQIHNDTLIRIYSTPKEPELPTGALIDVAKHLSNLKYRVWEKMLGTVQYTPVTLDPNTAPPCLSLSEGLTRVQYCTDNPQLPDNPERFTFAAEMLGSQGFTSGRHRWDVEVGDNTNWAVGVATQSVLRKKRAKLSRAEGILALRFMNGHYTTDTRSVSLQNKLRRVRVELDCCSRKVTFSDPACNIATIKFPFTKPVFPYFYSLCKKHPLHINPEKISIAVGPPNRVFYTFAFVILILILLILRLFYVLYFVIRENGNLKKNQSMTEW